MCKNAIDSSTVSATGLPLFSEEACMPTKAYLAEATGTFVLVFGGFGTAVLAEDHVGFEGVSAAFGLSLLATVYIIVPVSGCHVEPAFTRSLFPSKEPVSRLLTTGLLLFAYPAAAGDLRVRVDGINFSSGTVLVGLYDSALSFDRAIALSDKDGFLNDPNRLVGTALRAGETRAASVVFSDLPPGTYAIIAFHDENGNGRLDKNFWGVPTEPYAFSRDALGLLGPPNFNDAAMSLDGRDKSITITLHHHGDGAISDKAP
jgi:uncharacterized protein (DUF2141 family)